MKLAGISMIRNDADIVEPFVRHALRLLDHLFIIVHSPHDGTGEILSALHAEGLALTLVLDNEPAFLQGERLTWLAREAYAVTKPDFTFPLDADEFIVPSERDKIESALSALPADAPAGRIRLRTFVPTSDDAVGESHPLRRIGHRIRNPESVSKVVLGRGFALDRALVLDHGNHGLLRIGAGENQLPLSMLREIALAHYPVRTAAQVINKTIIGYLAHLAAGRPDVEEQRLATHWRRCYEDLVHKGATREMSEEQLLGWFHGRPDLVPRGEDLVRDPTPAPEALRYQHLIRNDAYGALARFAEALIRSRPGQLDAVRFDHGPNSADGPGTASQHISRPDEIRR